MPIPPRKKMPVLKGWPTLRLRESDLSNYFDSDSNIGLILGQPSGWLVDVDLDCEEACELADEYLPPTPAITGRPNAPNSHRWFYAKDAKTEKHTDPFTKRMIVELRSTGAQTVVGPSIHPDDGDIYDILVGEPARVPAAMLAACVAALADAVVKRRYGDTLPQRKQSQSTAKTPPREYAIGPELENRAIAYLEKLPPAISGQGGHAATYTAATALVHGFCIPPQRALQILEQYYNPRCEPPWSSKELRHKVDDAAIKPHDRDFGWLRDAERTPDAHEDPVDISAIVSKTCSPKRKHGSVMIRGDPTDDGDEIAVADPGPIPAELLSIPGFVSHVMQYTLETAPYPNRPLAFAGALALQAVLAGRKIREPGNLRTNVQILALANSGVGKDWPRKVNARVLLECGESRKLAGKSASGEGIEDRLLRHPIALKQDDEIDTLFANMQDNAEPRYRQQLATFLELYGEAGGWRSVRDKAGRENQIIHQPHLVLFGTTTPRAFYESMSARMLHKGLLARLTALEAGTRQRRQRATWPELPAPILDVARWWSEYRPPDWGNLSDEATGEPSPLVVPISDTAIERLDAFADECDARYAEAEKRGDEPVMAIWARAVEKATQLALIYACSVNHKSPQIDLPAVGWSASFVRHSILRALYMLTQHFHESDFEANCNAMYAKLQAWAKQKGEQAWMPHKALRKRLKRLDARQFEEAWQANVEIGRIEVNTETTGGRPGRVYRIVVSNPV